MKCIRFFVLFIFVIFAVAVGCAGKRAVMPADQNLRALYSMAAQVEYAAQRDAKARSIEERVIIPYIRSKKYLDLVIPNKSVIINERNNEAIVETYIDTNGTIGYQQDDLRVDLVVRSRGDIRTFADQGRAYQGIRFVSPELPYSYRTAMTGRTSELAVTGIRPLGMSAYGVPMVELDRQCVELVDKKTP